MNCENLMIGDWVMVKHTHREPSAERIEGVGRDVVLIKTESCMQSFGYDKVSPIPLTPEILEANGFYLGRTSQEEDLASAIGIHLRGEKWCVDDGDVEITVSFPNESDGGMVTIDNLSDKYMQFLFDETIFVHELQHALRLCGLNEIADNFKVE